MRKEVNKINNLEYRAVNEIRAVEDSEEMIIEGVVNNIGQWSKPIGGQFREKINEGVFERAINRALENGDIFFLHQHDNRALPLASVKSNTLELIEDKEENKVEKNTSDLNKEDNSTKNIKVKFKIVEVINDLFK